SVGAVHWITASLWPALAVTLVGAVGAPITTDGAAACGLLPRALNAATLYEKVVPFLSPVMVALVAFGPNVRADSATPPTSGVTGTGAVPSPGITVMLVTMPGSPTTISGLSGE